MSNVNLTVLIPSYMEEENLRLILPRLNDALKNTAENYEIIIIDTMEAMDNTKSVCLQNHCTYLPRENGNNYGDAIRTGIKYARGEYTIMMDADGSHSPEFIRSLYSYVKDYEIVIASRYVKGGSTDNNKLLIFMSYMTNLTYSVVLNLPYKDISNSFKLYRTIYLKDLNLKCKNFDIIEEILYKIKKNHRDVKIVEIPFSFKERMFGHTKRNLLLFICSYIITIVKLRFDL